MKNYQILIDIYTFSRKFIKKWKRHKTVNFVPIIGGGDQSSSIYINNYSILVDKNVDKIWLITQKSTEIHSNFKSDTQILKNYLTIILYLT